MNLVTTRMGYNLTRRTSIWKLAVCGRNGMRLVKFWPGLVTALFLTSTIPVAAQAPSAQAPDPLARIHAAAQGNAQACSATGETLCEQVAPKIIANAQGESPLAENLRRLTDEMEGRVSGPPTVARAVAWGVSAFRDAGLDVHTEKYAVRIGGPAEQENVVAEIRGREKPDEWVLVAAHLDSWMEGRWVFDNTCDAAMMIEAARDISRTGIRPRRSIRFVLFTGHERGMPGSWAYVRSHRAELDRARAAIIFHSRCGRVTGYLLHGRHDIEPGLREAMKPVESLGAGHYDFGAPLETDNFDFLVEGVPTLTAIQVQTSPLLGSPATSGTPEKFDIADLKHNTAIVAVTAFGIAERAAPIGPRQTRAEIEALLKASGLAEQMKITGLWPLWESGERGRLP
jgi:acetylornithine deacetylase/succinyl-diaminopimelate desuccinylase-like protein